MTSSSGRRRETRPRKPRPKGAQSEGDHGGTRLSEVRPEKVSPMANALTFAGYMTAMWLILQTVNSIRTTPTSGFVWSSALLGLVVGAATAVVKDERGIRSRLGITDFSSRRASVLWGVLGTVGIIAILTLPRYY